MNSFDPMSDCEWASGQLFDLREDALGAAETQALRAHLETCPHCRRDVVFDDRLRALFQRSNPLTPPNGFEQRVWHRLRRRQVVRSVAGVTSAALVAAGLMFWQGWLGAPAPPVSVGDPPPGSVAAGDLPESPVLFAAPPVDSLDLLARQQAGFVSVLQELEQE